MSFRQMFAALNINASSNTNNATNGINNIAQALSALNISPPTSQITYTNDFYSAGMTTAGAQPPNHTDMAMDAFQDDANIQNQKHAEYRMRFNT